MTIDQAIRILDNSDAGFPCGRADQEGQEVYGRQ